MALGGGGGGGGDGGDDKDGDDDEDEEDDYAAATATDSWDIDSYHSQEGMLDSFSEEEEVRAHSNFVFCSAADYTIDSNV